jgi:hypothetical protein
MRAILKFYETERNRIDPTNTREDRPIRINMKVFSREDLRRVFDFLGPKLKSSRRIGLVSDDTL